MHEIRTEGSLGSFLLPWGAFGLLGEGAAWRLDYPCGHLSLC